MRSTLVSMIAMGMLLSGLMGCQTVSFGNGYKADNCGITGASCSRQSRAGTVAMNGRR